MPTPDNSKDSSESRPSHFLRHVIENDLAQGRYASRRWAGSPGEAQHHAQAPLDTAKIRTRFPPEPNGYAHIGHAKSICLNFGLAHDYQGQCHLRIDDTNPEKEEQQYVDAMQDVVRWLGFDWSATSGEQPFFASNYFDFMFRAAQFLIERGLAYVDEQSAEQIRANRGSFASPGVASPYRERSVAQNQQRFAEMRAGQHADGAMVLRAKIDMASPNINLRDPTLYRIRRATHHATGDAWCIYPLYTFAHPIEDALENITHSFCTLEFEDQRPFYDWLLGHLAEGGLINTPAPRQYEFARLNLTTVVMSKRKLKQLVDGAHVAGWDDPRMPTIAGLRRRGYTAQSIRLFCERIGVSKADSWISYSVLEQSLREDLEPKAARAMAVLHPIKLNLVNWSEVFGSAEHREDCHAPLHPQQPDMGQRHFQLGSQLWIERSDFEQTPPKGFFRLYPGNKVRLKYAYVIECVDARYGTAGELIEVNAKLLPETKSGTPGSDSVKVKGVITWVAVHDALPAEVRLYQRLFLDDHPGAAGADPLESLNPNSLKVVQAQLEPSLATAHAGQAFQFERLGYFCADRVDHQSQRPVFNAAVGLKDVWAK